MKKIVFMLLGSQIILTIFLTYFLTILWVYRSEYKKKVYNEDFIATYNIGKIKFSSFKSESLFNYLQIFKDFYENFDTTRQSSNKNITKLWSFDNTQSISEESWEILLNISSVVESISLFSPICIFIKNESFSVSVSHKITEQTCNISNNLNIFEKDRYFTQVYTQNNQLFQHFCINFSGILACFLKNPTYPDSLIISQNMSTIWHPTLHPTIPLSEYPEDYFLSNEERFGFTEKFFLNTLKPSSFKYQQKGSEKTLHCSQYLSIYNFCIKSDSVDLIFSNKSDPFKVLLFFSFLFTIFAIYLLTLYLAFSAYQQIYQRFILELEFLNHCLNFEPYSLDLKLLQRSLKQVKLLKNFKNPVSSDYSQQLWEYSQEIVVFEQIQNWKSVCKAFRKVAELQFFNDFNFEAVKNIGNSVKVLKKMGSQWNKEKILLVEIFLDLFYEGNLDIIKDALRMCQGVNGENPHFLMLKIIVLAKTGFVDEAENIFLRLGQGADLELKDFVAGVLLKQRKLIKRAAKTFFFTLTLQKYYNPKVRKWCKAELQSLFPKENIEKTLKNQEFYNEVVILCENSQFVNPDFLNTYKKELPKVLKVLEQHDLVSLYLYGQGVTQLCPLLPIQAHRKLLKNCLKNLTPSGTQPKMLKCLNRAIIQLSLPSLQNNTLDWLLPNDSKVPHKLIILLATGQDYSKFDLLIEGLNTNRIYFLILAMDPASKDQEKLIKLKKKVTNSKFVCSHSASDFKKNLLRVKSLFI